MRTLALFSLLAMPLVACTVGDTGGDDVAADCGNNAIDASETCDDGNTTSGDGCSSTCQTEVTPQLSVTVDKPSVTTELGSKTMLTLALTSTGGFTGPVTLAGSAVDGANNPITGWTVTLPTPPSVDVPADGTVNAVAELDIASDATILSGTVKIDATGGPTVQTVLSAITVMNQITLTVDLNGNGECVYPSSGQANAVPIKAGTTVRFFNKSQTLPFEIHSNNDNAIPHQGQGAGADDPVTEPQTAYTKVLGGNPGTVFSWYCHSPGPDMNAANPFIAVR